MNEYQANIYPGNVDNPTITHADPNRKNIAVCFSGGGSRALTCAWGQLIGLNTLKDENGKPFLDEVRYISSVSGGSWAAVLYTFRPESFTDDEFLGNSYSPSQLYYDQDKPGGLNVSKMGPSALGKIPQNFSNLFEPDPLKNIIAEFFTIIALKGIHLNTSAKWLWAYIVGENVLADFDLYSYKNSIFKRHETPWQYSDAKFFSLSKAYAASNIFSKAKAPPQDAFVYARTDSDGQPACPMLIVNTNIVAKNCPGNNMTAPIQIPTQVSAVAAGIYGANPCTVDSVGGGCVESFAFTSDLLLLSGAAEISGEFPRRFTLADITADSSAFYAATLIELMRKVMAKLMEHNNVQLHSHFLNFVKDEIGLILSDIQSILANIHGKLSAMNEELKSLSIEDLVPQYNYWSVNQVSQGAAANQNTDFTDGGNLENTGVAGLLAQVQGTVSNIIAFVNGSEVLEQKQGQIIAATQIAPLFGVAYHENQGLFKNYLPGGVNPFTHQTDPAGFLQVFDNSNAEFDNLRLGLYTANGAGAKTDAAFFLQTLKVVENTLLGITQTHLVNMLWVQNAQVNNWQNLITDATLLQKIQAGQKMGFLDELDKLDLLGKLDEFANFPYYNTFFKIHQTAAETNTLAQMWAWCVSNKDSPLSAAIVKMFAMA
jgi:hypothetical protein